MIVESPAKARTIAGYLGDDFVVESSVGHIRDLPQRAADIPAKHKKEPWARLGVNVEKNFEPLYILDADKKKTVDMLKKRVAEADEVLLATDEDREGEAIGWHLLEVLKPKVPVRRMVFHEITADAIRRALAETRGIDERLVDAQETRRILILDRLYGYEVSPVLWKKIMRGLSAGRVQSVATRLVVERERERMAFVSASWWDIKATFAPDAFEAQLFSLDDRRIATGRDLGPDGQLRDDALLVLDEPAARGLAERLEGVPFRVRSVESKPYSRRPSAPFMTSTLQQEASRKLRFTAQTTMRVAQRLYENGYITYMRTDSTTLSDSALSAYVPDQPRRYEKKVKNAQEAHEAIRPAGDTFRTPQAVARELSKDELALYELVWIRTIASQMADAKGQTVSVRIVGEPNPAPAAVGSTEAAVDGGGGFAAASVKEAEFAAAGTAITFRGFLAAYEEGRDETVSASPSREDDERRLPVLKEGQELQAARLVAEGHETNPPARYTEATLVRALEQRGIGRPSTYASIIGTIQDRGYVFKKDSALVPSFLAFAVVGLLEQHFGQLVDYDFTARMEDALDRIAAGDEERVGWLRRFYYGDGESGLKDLVEDLGGIDAREISSVAIGDGIVLRVGRYGAYLERDGTRANVPDDLVPDELTVEKAEELLAQPSGDRALGTDPETGREIAVRSGRYGPFVTEVDEDMKEKPRTASLFKKMSPETVTLDEALQLLSLPRVLGTGEDGEEVLARNGRFGPYIQKGKETRSLEREEQLLEVTLEEALALLAKPKQGRRRGAAQPPLRELGEDPLSGKAVEVKDGRFGPYVTDGETNASLRSADSVESVTLERASELLAERRAKGPAKGSRKRGAAKR
ncbi:MAG: type I DNA topoisomerase [Actinobacteria bacterium]|nr:MAG: type I DNA topoisomerase [Actinomycetota bacterium]